jgi:hypothetical protein
MPVQIENFYHTFPHDLVEIALSDGSRFPMRRRTSGVFFDCFLNVRHPLAHASTISTRSRTVHKLFATPAAIAGVHRIASGDCSASAKRDFVFQRDLWKSDRQPDFPELPPQPSN